MDNILTKHRSFWICLALTLATTAVFWQVCTYDFINYDDPAYVYENPNIQNGVTLKAVKWAFTTGRTGNWHPLTWLSHILDWRLFGPRAGGHHLISLVLHIANALLLFIVLKQMTHTLWQSAFVAALFALHPLHIESVAWVAERKDVLSTFFWMLTMWAYVRFVSRPKIASYLLVVVFFALGLISKPMLVTLPFVLLLLDYWPLERLGPKGEKHSLSYLLFEKVPLFAMSLASCVVTFIVQRKAGAVTELTGFSLKLRIYNAFISYMQYITKMIWPARLAPFYPHPSQNISILYAVISAALLLTITILIFRSAKAHRYLLTGWLWYLGTLIPVIGLVQVGGQALADRYTYVTLTGLFIIIAWGLPALLAKWQYKKIVLTSSALLIILVMSICTYFQLRYWRSSMTLFQHALDVTEGNYIAHAAIADSLRTHGRLDESIYHYSEAVRIRPDLANTLSDFGITLNEAGRTDEAIACYEKALEVNPRFAAAHINLGLALAAKGKFAEAVRHYKIAAEITDIPNIHHDLGYALLNLGRFEQAVTEYRKALSETPDNPYALNKLGYALAHIGKFDEAVSVLNEALRIKPDFADAHANLGYTSVLRDNPDEAAVHLAESLRLDPNRAQAHYYLGQILAQKDKIDEAVAHFEEALRLEPDWVEPMNNLAWLLAASKKTTIHNPDKAIRLANRACELTNYTEPEPLDTLAVAYAAAGEFSKAIEITEKALELCQSSEQEPFKEKFKKRLALYKAGKPYIEK